MGVEESAVCESNGDEKCGVGAGGEHFAVGEVDHEQYAVDKGVADGDQRVDTASCESVDDERSPVSAVEHSRTQCCGGPACDPIDDCEAECDEDDPAYRQSFKREPTRRSSGLAGCGHGES